MKSQDNLRSLNHTDERAGAPGALEQFGWKRASVRTRLEAAARNEFELRAGRPIGDGEWESTKARLLEFARMLRAFDQQATTPVHAAAEAITLSQGYPDAA